jgi:hypothetical protein
MRSAGLFLAASLAGACASASAPSQTVLKTVDGAWQVEFQPGRGAPQMVIVDHLSSWSESAYPGVQRFSGSAIYRKVITLPPRPRGARLELDLGDVRDEAAVTVNGKPLGALTTPPFRVDITQAVRRGANTLEVKVTDLSPDAPQRLAGLIGPVQVLAMEKRR